jgi:hypothetical protein
MPNLAAHTSVHYMHAPPRCACLCASHAGPTALRALVCPTCMCVHYERAPPRCAHVCAPYACPTSLRAHVRGPCACPPGMCTTCMLKLAVHMFMGVREQGTLRTRLTTDLPPCLPNVCGLCACITLLRICECTTCTSCLAAHTCLHHVHAPPRSAHRCGSNELPLSCPASLSSASVPYGAHPCQHSTHRCRQPL